MATDGAGKKLGHAVGKGQLESAAKGAHPKVDGNGVPRGGKGAADAGRVADVQTQEVLARVEVTPEGMGEMREQGEMSADDIDLEGEKVAAEQRDPGNSKPAGSANAKESAGDVLRKVRAKKLAALGARFDEVGGLKRSSSAAAARGGDVVPQELQKEKLVRKHMQEKGLVCYKIRVNRADVLEVVVELIVERAGLVLVKDEVTAGARRPVACSGEGEGLTGALCRIFFPEALADGLRSFNDGGDSVTSFQMWIDGLCIEVGRERLGGAQGRLAFAMTGLEESIAAKKTAAFPCKAGRVTEALVACWAHTFGGKSEEAMFQVRRKFLGKTTVQGKTGSKRVVDCYGDMLYVAEEAEGQLQQLLSLDMQLFASWETIGVAAVKRVKEEEAFSLEAAKIQVRVLGQGGVNSEEEMERTLMVFNLHSKTTREDLIEAVIEGVNGCSGDDKLSESDFEDVIVRMSQRGKNFGRMRMRSVAAMQMVWWAEDSPPIKELSDGGGRQGVKMRKDSLWSDRQGSGGGGVGGSVSGGGIRMRPGAARAAEASERQVAEVLDMDRLVAMLEARVDAKLDKMAGMVADKMFAMMIDPKGRFVQAMAKAVGGEMRTVVSSIKQKVEVIADTLEGAGAELDRGTPEAAMQEGDSFGSLSLKKNLREEIDSAADQVIERMAKRPAQLQSESFSAEELQLLVQMRGIRNDR